MKKKIFGTFAVFAVVLAGSFAAQAKGWELSEDEKHWMYYYSRRNPAVDEWVQDDGKFYYLDSKGYMKTGWITDGDDGKKYYLGEDGAMWVNAFTPDNYFVGKDGARMDSYDAYRKAVKSELRKSVSKKSSKKKKSEDAAQDEEQLKQYFLFTDLNADGYRDLVVMDGYQEAETIQKVLVWEPEEKKFQLSAEFDRPEDGQRSALYLDPEGGEVWLEMAEPSGELQLFRIGYESAVFESIWNFTMEPDNWGDARYYVNGNDAEREYWEKAMEQARLERGTIPLTGYVEVTEDNINAQVDLVLNETEQMLWEE